MEKKCSLPEMLPEAETGGKRAHTQKAFSFCPPLRACPWGTQPGAVMLGLRHRACKGQHLCAVEQGSGENENGSQSNGHRAAHVVRPEILWAEVKGVLRKLTLLRRPSEGSFITCLMILKANFCIL